MGALQKFAKGLKPVCSPAKLDLCDDETKAKIKELQAMSAADLDKAIKEKDDEIAAAEKKFTDEVDKLQKKYQELQEEKTRAILAAIKTPVEMCVPSFGRNRVARTVPRMMRGLSL